MVEKDTREVFGLEFFVPVSERKIQETSIEKDTREIGGGKQ